MLRVRSEVTQSGMNRARNDSRFIPKVGSTAFLLCVTPKNEFDLPDLGAVDSVRVKGTKGAVMQGFVQDTEEIAVKNEAFRRVLYTAKNCQLVVMALKPGEEIGAEVHKLDQFFRVEEGTGEIIVDGVRTAI